MKKITLAVGISAVALFAGPVSDLCRQEMWVTDGAVRAVFPAGDKVYIGGSFNVIGPYTGCGVPVDATSGTPLPAAYPKIAGTVMCACPDNGGGYFVAGLFRQVNGVDRSHIIHVNVDGTLDPAFSPGRINGSVAALALSGSTLYAGGYFDSVGIVAGGPLAAFNATDGSLIDWNLGIMSRRQVQALATAGNTLYVGGTFDSIGTSLRRNLAAVDLTTGTLLAWNPEVNRGVVSIAATEKAVFIAGYFDTIGEVRRRYLAAVDPATGNATSWNPDPEGSVYALALCGSTLYAGGRFSTMVGVERNNIAAFNLSNGGLTAFNVHVNWTLKKIDNGGIKSIGATDEAVYIGGLIDTIGGQFRNNTGAVDPSTGAVLPWNPSTSGEVRAIATGGSFIFIGGHFYITGCIPRKNLAAIDTATGSANAWNPGVFNSGVHSFASYGTTLYVGGEFGRIDTASRNSLAAFDMKSGNLTVWDAATGSGSNNVVHAIAASVERVFIAGTFNSVGQVERRYLAAVDMSSAAATPWDPAPDDNVRSLAINGTIVYVGGTFKKIGSTSQKYIAALEMATGAVVSWNPGADNSVRGMVLSGNTLYVGGTFDSIGGAPRTKIAALDATTGSAFSWAPVLGGDTLPDEVFSLALDGNTVFAGGTFNQTDGTHRNLAAFDATTGGMIDWQTAVYDSTVFSVAFHGSTVYAGGSFSRAGKGVGHPKFAAFRVDTSTANVRINRNVSQAGRTGGCGLSCTGRIIRYSIAERMNVSLDIFSISGRKVFAIVNGNLPAGEFRTTLPVGTVSPGIYTLVLRAGGAERRMMVSMMR